MLYASNSFAITPSDTADIPATTAGVVVAVGGTLTVTTVGGSKAALTVPAGLIPIIVTRVWATGTTATGITGLRI